MDLEVHSSKLMIIFKSTKTQWSSSKSSDTRIHSPEFPIIFKSSQTRRSSSVSLETRGPSIGVPDYLPFVYNPNLLRHNARKPDVHSSEFPIISKTPATRKFPIIVTLPKTRKTWSAPDTRRPHTRVPDYIQIAYNLITIILVPRHPTSIHLNSLLSSNRL